MSVIFLSKIASPCCSSMSLIVSTAQNVSSDNSCLVIRWHFWCCSTGRGQRLVPGNAEEAAGIEIDEEQDAEEEPPNLLNGTVPSALSGVTADTSSLLWPTFSLLPPTPLSPFIHPRHRELFVLPCQKQMMQRLAFNCWSYFHSASYYMLCKSLSIQNIRLNDILCVSYVRQIRIMKYMGECPFPVKHTLQITQNFWAIPKRTVFPELIAYRRSANYVHSFRARGCDILFWMCAGPPSWRSCSQLKLVKRSRAEDVD